MKQTVDDAVKAAQQSGLDKIPSVEARMDNRQMDLFGKPNKQCFRTAIESLVSDKVDTEDRAMLALLCLNFHWDCEYCHKFLNNY